MNYLTNGHLSGVVIWVLCSHFCCRGVLLLLYIASKVLNFDCIFFVAVRKVIHVEAPTVR